MRCKSGVLALVVLASMTIFSQGCAWPEPKGTVRITSQPEGASYVIYNGKMEAVDSGTTPATVTLKRRAGHFSPQKYTVKFTKAGCCDCEAQIEYRISGCWYLWGNLIFSPIEYLIGNPMWRPMWTLKDLHVDMEPGPRAEVTEVTENTLEIATIDQIPTGLTPRLVRVDRSTNR